MAHRQDRALIAEQILLQPAQHPEIEMVGRLVENQQLRLLDQQLCEHQPGALAARHPLHRSGPLKTAESHAAEHRIDLHLRPIAVETEVPLLQRLILPLEPVVFSTAVVGEGGHPLSGFQHLLLNLEYLAERPAHLAFDRSVGQQAAVLPQISDPQRIGARDAPLIRLVQSGNQVQEGGFPGSIRPDQGDAVPVLYFCVDFFENSLGAKAFAEIADGH